MSKFTYEITQDEFAENPASSGLFENVGVVCTALRNYSFGNIELSINADNLDAAFLEHLQEEGLKRSDVITLPIYIYDHSGITISTAPFSCSWDSGKIGFIYTTKKKAREEFGRIYTARAIACMNSEIETLDHYVTGEVYTLTTFEDGEEIDHCGGYYGRKYAEEEGAAEVARFEAFQIKREARALLNAQFIAMGE